MATAEQLARMSEALEIERLVSAYEEAQRAVRKACLRENGKLPTQRMLARAAAAAVLREAATNRVVAERGLFEVAEMIRPFSEEV